jgi:hypothetical protein
MDHKGSKLRSSNITPEPQIPLWLAVHEAGHVVARLQLVAAWHLDGLDNPSSLEIVRVWIDESVQPRGLCEWGYQEPLSFRYQAIISAAGSLPRRASGMRSHTSAYEPGRITTL